ncbi:SDR family oxidoreductase [Candidatus Nitrosotenuis cloacae]|uniref:SDR family oxidoreductase n=1 Tax=Candidatus Nitrosotenuis cloacae TaxID=1603555 RepID=UPI002280793E|nr:SDR family oxidoreductase [Candidatus Nitrosotenuis cloacae]
MSFQNKVVVITGASSGIGAASCAEFAKRGATVVLVARRREKLEEIQASLAKYGATSMIIQCDVSKREQVEEMGRKVIGRFGKVDVLVNNAGFAIYGAVSDLTVDEIESQMATNYLGMVYCTKCLLPKMLEQKSGHIVNVASVAASFGLPGIASYCASKFAMLGFSEGLSHELEGTGVGVTVVSPIMVRTSFFDHRSFSSMPKYSPTALSAETVARSVVSAASSRRLEVIVPSVVRLAVWAKHTIPYVINPIIGAAFKRQLKK